MRIEIQERGLDNVNNLAVSYKRFWPALRRRSLYETTQSYKGRIYDWIKKAGGGTWPDFHPLSRKFILYRSGGKPQSWVRRGRILGRNNWSWLSQFVTSYSGSSQARIRFGRPKERKFSRLAERARWVEAGHETPVTDAMRRMFGATRKSAGRKAVPGKTFFPLRKATSQLKIAPHPVMAPVFARWGKEIGKNFEKSFDRQYRKFERETT